MPVDTAVPDRSKVALTEEGKVDFAAYRGLLGQIQYGELTVDVNIEDARLRFGHLDLLVTPACGHGYRWVELKNIDITNDPGVDPFILEDPPLKDVTVVETADGKGFSALIQRMNARIK